MAAGCRICGAKVKRKGGGLLVCRSGHVQQGAQEQVTESVGLFARRTRRVRRIKVRRLRPRGYLVVTAELFLEAYQYSLRSLSEELVRKKGLPSSFPETVLDIWLFFVSHQQKDRHGKKDGTPSFNGALRDVDRLVFLLLACNAMRIPATCADFARWAETGTIRYLNWMDILPPSLKSSFSVADLALRTSQKSAPPNAREIRRRMILVRERFERWGFLFQEANVEGVAARIVRTIGLPPELYVCMMTLHELHELHGRFASLENNDLTVSPVDADVYLLAIAFVCIKICYNLQSATMEDESRFAFVVRLAKSLRLNSVLDAIGPRMTAEELDSTYFGFIGAYMDMAERDVFSKEMPKHFEEIGGLIPGVVGGKKASSPADPASPSSPRATAPTAAASTPTRPPPQQLPFYVPKPYGADEATCPLGDGSEGRAYVEELTVQNNVLDPLGQAPAAYSLIAEGLARMGGVSVASFLRRVRFIERRLPGMAAMVK